MRFLIKAVFWLGLVICFLPAPDNAKAPGVSTVDAIAFLSTAVNDIKGFCTRNPDSCVTGAAAMQRFGEKAEYGAKILHEFISAKVDESKDLLPPKGSRTQLSVNQTAQASGNQSVRSAGNTLTPQDLMPAFRPPKVAQAQN